jgi:uncharacterized protein YggE
MKKRLILLICVLSASLMISAYVPAGAATEVAKATIETNATNQIEVSPDIAYINASINVVDESREKAASINKSSTTAMIEQVISAGILKTDIKTTSFYANAYIDRVIVDPKDPSPTYKDVKKYQTTSNFKIAVKDITKVGDVLDKLLAVDNVNIGNINYDVKDVSKYKNQAIKGAVLIAKENIMDAAEASGVKLDKLQTMSVDFSSNNSQPYPIYAKAMVASADSTVYQNPENIKITATVHVVYNVK